MPYVNVQITKGATREQKAQMVKDITNSLVNVLGKKPEHIHIVIQEIEDENCGATPRRRKTQDKGLARMYAHQDRGYSGLLTDDWKKQLDR